MTHHIDGYDASLFSGPSASPAWEDSYVPGQVVTPVSALWADRGIRDGIRSGDPARAAADRFADLLQDAGVDVDGEPRADPAPDDPTTAQRRPLATVSSATVICFGPRARCSCAPIERARAYRALTGAATNGRRVCPAGVRDGRVGGGGGGTGANWMSPAARTASQSRAASDAAPAAWAPTVTGAWLHGYAPRASCA